MSYATFSTSTLQLPQYLTDATIDDQFVLSEAVLPIDVYEEIGIIVHVAGNITIQFSDVT